LSLINQARRVHPAADVARIDTCPDSDMRQHYRDGRRARRRPPPHGNTGRRG